jgi:hypothetical protein
MKAGDHKEGMSINPTVLGSSFTSITSFVIGTYVANSILREFVDV